MYRGMMKPDVGKKAIGQESSCLLAPRVTGHGINGENRMQKNTTKFAALADRAIST